METLSEKIKASGGDLAARTIELSPSLREYESILKTFYQIIGDFLHSEQEELEHIFRSYAKLFAGRLISTPSTADGSMKSVSVVRKVLLDFLERQSADVPISAIFKVLKKLDPLLQMMSASILTHYHENLLLAKFELDESNKDLQITLKELADLKKALNEATIFAITDKNDVITYVNDKFCTISKYDKEELIGQSHHILNSSFHPAAFFDEILTTIKHGHVWKGEILNRAKDGSEYWVDTTVVPFLDDHGKIYQHISIQYDITDTKRTEDMLRKAEKLSMVGELAAGIAHEIRNPMTAIKGFVQLLDESYDGMKYADTILAEIERINFIVSEFMVFAKPHATYFSKCSLPEIVNSVIKLLEPEALLKNVVISLSVPSDEVSIFGESNQLKQVFLNMLKNAIESMSAGGNIYVSIEKDSKQIKVSIQDTGIGLSDEEIQKLGIPFYTTKSNGNGLGLMVSYKIVQNHGGQIEVTSAVNKGTCFTLLFPVKSDGV
ncbi:PAS domain-containing protein [Bacillus sp. F19]|nr:PAS domain-containing protein [Bacillus sp. F19]